MSKVKGQHLVVNLSASQTRNRLKGFGHGVRKVQTAGRNQAVVIHTATGRHLEELIAKFADVGTAADANELDQPIENLRNIGPASAGWLRDAGIATIAELQRFGAAFAFQAVRRRQPDVSLNLLWAMAAGLDDRDWRELAANEKFQLLEQVDQE